MRQKKNPSDLVGKTFNRWHVDSFSHTAKSTDYYNCTCFCGTKKIISKWNLIYGRSKSCGCLTRKIKLDNANYHSIRANLSYVDCSTYKNFIGTPGMKACECKALAIAKGEYVRPMTDALMVGS